MPHLEQLLVGSATPSRDGVSGSAIGGVLLRPFRVALVGVGDAQQRRLVEQPAGQLQADRQAARR